MKAYLSWKPQPTNDKVWSPAICFACMAFFGVLFYYMNTKLRNFVVNQLRMMQEEDVQNA